MQADVCLASVLPHFFPYVSLSVVGLCEDTLMMRKANYGNATVYNRWHETELERWLSDHGEFLPLS